MTLRNCARCETEFSLPPSKALRARVFCSSDCHMADRADHQITVTCAQCGKVFQSVKALATRKRFCSKACHRAFYRMSETEQRTCPICQTTYTSLISKVREHLTCSPECAKESRTRPHKNKRVKRTEIQQSSKLSRTCERCGTAFLSFPSRKGRYCSRACVRLSAGIHNQGVIRSSIFVPCDYCGKQVKKFRCRLAEAQHAFCNKACYHAWDSLYKSTPEMLTKLCDRLRDGFGKPSKLEDRVAQWLDQHNLSYERQSTLKVYSIDFKVGDIYIEVQGCYWHGCVECFLLYTPRQRQQQAQDRSKATYCRKRNIRLYIIWEHDIEHDNFSALAPLLELQHAVTKL